MAGPRGFERGLLLRFMPFPLVLRSAPEYAEGYDFANPAIEEALGKEHDNTRQGPLRWIGDGKLHANPDYGNPDRHARHEQEND